MPLLIIPYIMHKNGGTKTREKSSVAPRENKNSFLENKVYWSQKHNPLASSRWFQSALYFDTSV